MSARQTRVAEAARKHIGSDAWSLWARKTSADGLVCFNPTEPKCNLFVYEMLVEGGVGQSLPNTAGTRGQFLNNKTARPYTAEQWHKGEVPGMTCVGSGAAGLDKSWPGDIVTNGHHVGIISAPQKTISASSKENKIVENAWGWRPEERENIKVFRYHP